MHKKHIFLNVFQKIMLFACVFCTISTWAETTTCDINYTPVTGNSIQNGTPTPTSPVEIESIGTKVGNKYQISVTAQGKNLFDKNNVVLDYSMNENGTLFATTGDAVSDFIRVKPNTTYYLSRTGSRRGKFFKEDKQPVQTATFDFTTASSGTSFTTGPTTYYIRTASSKFADYKETIQLEEGSVATPYAPYSAPITTSIYLNAPLRKVGAYADILDYKKGQIIRNVGVKVLDGTEEDLAFNTTYNVAYFFIQDKKIGGTGYTPLLCSHLKLHNVSYTLLNYGEIGSTTDSKGINMKVSSNITSLALSKQWLAQQYANGTPVTIYYPLATPVVEQIENWSCIPPITDIQIATTKFVDEEFKAAEAKLATTVQTIESVVSRTITQTGQIATLHETKQTRPDESCPANMKCLLVQDEDGTPHWYPIIEP